MLWPSFSPFTFWLDASDNSADKSFILVNYPNIHMVKHMVKTWWWTPIDFYVLLKFSIGRLCIWQISVSSDMNCQYSLIIKITVWCSIGEFESWIYSRSYVGNNGRKIWFLIYSIFSKFLVKGMILQSE